MRFDRVAILDWSAAKGPKRGKDSIWLAVADSAGVVTENIPTRLFAERRLTDLIAQSVSHGKRLLIGADFAFGFPMGFAARLTGQASALSVWDWLSARITDTAQNTSNYRDVAALMNARFDGSGPFWGNTARLDVPGLPRLKPPLPPGLVPHRTCDMVARESGAHPKTVWQLAGAGAVGAQVLTGLPVLNRLRQQFPGHLSVWPFEAPQSLVVLAEVYPSLLHAQVRHALLSSQEVADQVQVRLLSQALFRHASQGSLHRMMSADVDAATSSEEGWLLAAGRSADLAGPWPEQAMAAPA